MWALVVFLAVIIAVHWWEYGTTKQEYIFAQPATLDHHDELSTVLQEKTPIAVEIGSLPWRPEVASKANWKVCWAATENVEGSMPMSQWLTDREANIEKSVITNNESLAEEMALTTGLSDLDAGRPWWWLPGLRHAQVDVLEPGQTLGLTWITAERHWIGCSHGEPVTIWLVHSRYRRFLPVGTPSTPVNPWTLTVAEAQWIGRVQYIEVTVKPGWCIGLPAHWGFAARLALASTGPMGQAPDGAANASWIWSADQHSLFSLGLELAAKKIRSATTEVQEAVQEATSNANLGVSIRDGTYSDG